MLDSPSSDTERTREPCLVARCRASTSNTIIETKTLREVQHQENVKRLDLQDAALSEIKKISGANVISFHKKLVQGLVGLQMLLLAVLAALLQHFVLSKM